MNDTKVKAIVDWPTPTTVTQIQHFHGLASYHRCFIQEFGVIMTPITQLMNVKEFAWTKEVAAAFDVIKKRSHPLMLWHFRISINTFKLLVMLAKQE